jgi:predicted anti-sigma-YlaC factor YlaD
MLTCQEITELVTAYVERRMSLMQRARFRMHIGMCKHCRRYLRQMRTTVRLTGAMPADPMPRDVRDELARRLSTMRRAPPPCDEAKKRG